MFVGPPKLVFIKTTEGGAQAALRPGGPKGQTILVAPQVQDSNQSQTITISPARSVDRESPVEISTPRSPRSPRVLRRQTEKKYGKRQRTQAANDDEAKDKDVEDSQDNNSSEASSTSKLGIYCVFCLLH